MSKDEMTRADFLKVAATGVAGFFVGCGDKENPVPATSTSTDKSTETVREVIKEVTVTKTVQPPNCKELYNFSCSPQDTGDNVTAENIITYNSVTDCSVNGNVMTYPAEDTHFARLDRYDDNGESKIIIQAQKANAVPARNFVRKSDVTWDPHRDTDMTVYAVSGKSIFRYVLSGEFHVTDMEEVTGLDGFNECRSPPAASMAGHIAIRDGSRMVVLKKTGSGWKRMDVKPNKHFTAHSGPAWRLADKKGSEVLAYAAMGGRKGQNDTGFVIFNPHSGDYTFQKLKWRNVEDLAWAPRDECLYYSDCQPSGGINSEGKFFIGGAGLCALKGGKRTVIDSSVVWAPLSVLPETGDDVFYLAETEGCRLSVDNCGDEMLSDTDQCFSAIRSAGVGKKPRVWKGGKYKGEDDRIGKISGFTLAFNPTENRMDADSIAPEPARIYFSQFEKGLGYVIKGMPIGKL
jgi:hypothetical protein